MSNRSFFDFKERKRMASTINAGDYVICNTHEYRHLNYGERYYVKKTRDSYRGNNNLVIENNSGYSNCYWAGNFIKDNKVTQRYPHKNFRYVIYDEYGNIEYQSNCIRCINTYVEQKEKENHIC